MQGCVFASVHAGKGTPKKAEQQQKASGTAMVATAEGCAATEGLRYSNGCHGRGVEPRLRGDACHSRGFGAKTNPGVHIGFSVNLFHSAAGASAGAGGGGGIASAPSAVAMRSLDIFAGCGGLSEGMHQAGVAQSRWAIEYEQPAADAFKLNYPDAKVFCNNCNVLLMVRGAMVVPPPVCTCHSYWVLFSSRGC
eukprot:1158821-Pelagomonas_calceolata.AAC.5